MSPTHVGVAAPGSSTPEERKSQIAGLIAIALVRCRRRERLDCHWTDRGLLSRPPRASMQTPLKRVQRRDEHPFA